MKDGVHSKQELVRSFGMGAPGLGSMSVWGFLLSETIKALKLFNTTAPKCT